MPIAYSYIRFSSLKQSRGRSEERQEESPEPWCKANGYTLDQSLKLRDLGRSGYHGDHIKGGKLGVFLALVEDNKIVPGSVLLIEHLDRLTRQDPFTGMEVISSIIRKGVDIVTLMDGERYSLERLTQDFGVQLKLQFTLFQGHAESDKKSKRLKDVWKSKRATIRDGKRLTGRYPSWLDKTTREPIPEKADIVRRIFTLAMAGQGINTIARTLNAERIKPIGHGKSWSGTLIKYYLNNRTVIGEYQPCRVVAGKDTPEGDPIEGYYCLIIDRHTFFNVQQQLNVRKARHVVGRNSKGKNIFTRLLFSLYDGGRYRYKQSHDDRGKGYDHRRLIPTNRVDGVADCMTLHIDYQAFEGAFFKFVTELDPADIFSPQGQDDKAKELATIKTDLIEIEGKIKETQSRISKSKNISFLLDTGEKLDTERDRMLRRIEILKSELVTSETKIFDDLREGMLKGADRDQIEGAIRLLVERINLLPIHLKTGRHRKTTYLLYVEVVFNNKEIRCFVTDDKGVREPDETGVSPPGNPILVRNALASTVLRHNEGMTTEMANWGYSFKGTEEERKRVDLPHEWWARGGQLLKCAWYSAGLR